jgi:molecular chaperone HtpG
VIKDSSDPMAGMAAMFAQMGQEMPEIPLILEINPDHELVKKLENVKDETLFKDMAWLLLDTAKLSEGIEPKDKTAFAQRIAKLATKAI